MGTKNIEEREEEINKVIFKNLESLDGVKILAPNHKKRLSIFSFYFEKYHFKLFKPPSYGFENGDSIQLDKYGTFKEMFTNVHLEFNK